MLHRQQRLFISIQLPPQLQQTRFLRYVTSLTFWTRVSLGFIATTLYCNHSFTWQSQRTQSLELRKLNNLKDGVEFYRAQNSNGMYLDYWGININGLSEESTLSTVSAKMWQYSSSGGRISVLGQMMKSGKGISNTVVWCLMVTYPPKQLNSKEGTLFFAFLTINKISKLTHSCRPRTKKNRFESKGNMFWLMAGESSLDIRVVNNAFQAMLKFLYD